MAGHNRSKNGVAWLACVPAIHVFLCRRQDVDARHKAGHDVDRSRNASRRHATLDGAFFDFAQ